jgi:hypothetical protein
MQRTQFRASAPAERVRLIRAQAQARARLVGVLAEACAGSGADWPARLAAAVAAGIEFAAEAPEQARLLLPGAAAIDPALEAGVEQTEDFLVGLLRRGREHCPEAAGMPEATELGMVAAATSLVAAKLLRGQTDALPSVVSPLTELLLAPYVGIEHASLFSPRR